MTPSISNAINAYSRVADSGNAAAGKSGATVGESSFADLLNNAAEKVVDNLQASETQSMKAVAGVADVTDVAMAVSKAEMTVEMVVGVRDKMIEAYQEILRMPI